MNRIFDVLVNLGHRAGTVALAAVMFFVMTVGLAGCNQQADITKVLAILPTVEGITNSIGAAVAGVDPAIAVPVNMALATVDTSFAVVEGILKTYQGNLNSAPQSVLNDLDAAIAAIQSNLVAISGQIPGLSAAILAAVNVGLTALQAVLGFVASLLPAPVAAALFPKSYHLLVKAGVVFGTHAAVPSARSFAKSYNAQIDAVAGGVFKSNKKLHVHVPWVRVAGLPVMP